MHSFVSVTAHCQCGRIAMTTGKISESQSSAPVQVIYMASNGVRLYRSQCTGWTVMDLGRV